MEDYKVDRRKWTDQKEKILEALNQAYTLVYNNCDLDIQATLEEDPSFKQMDDDLDVLLLFKKLELLAYNGVTTSEPIHSLVKIIKELFTLTQGDHENIEKFYDSFNALLAAANSLCGGDGKLFGGYFCPYSSRGRREDRQLPHCCPEEGICQGGP